MDYGQLYDTYVADTYDEDALGLLAGARSLGLAQIGAAALPADATILDLGVGTGATLAALAPLVPRGRMIGVDLSARMIDVARAKLDFEAHVDDACNAARLVAAQSVDLAVAHFLTTFVDRRRLFGVAATTLRPGGLLSVVSSTSDAFRHLRGLIAGVVGDAVMQAASPTPEHADVLAADLTASGLEVVATDTFRRPLRFDSFEQCLGWGLTSGFFTHVIEALGMDRIVGHPHKADLFPLDDEYVGVAILARRPVRPGIAGA